MGEKLLDRRWVQITVAAVFLTVAIISMVNAWTIASYIRHTEPRDAAQEQCIVDQAQWLQEWLKWRWQENIDATKDQIVAYQQAHPQPPCQIKR